MKMEGDIKSMGFGVKPSFDFSNVMSSLNFSDSTNLRQRVPSVKTVGHWLVISLRIIRSINSETVIIVVVGMQRGKALQRRRCIFGLTLAFIRNSEVRVED